MISTGRLDQLKSGRTSAPRLPQAPQMKRGSRSDSRMLCGKNISVSGYLVRRLWKSRLFRVTGNSVLTCFRGGRLLFISFWFFEMNFQVTILRVLASYPNGIVTFDSLKRDLEFLASSGRDWSDRTRRLAAHLPGLSIFSMGLVERHPHGWQLTNKGQSVLQFMEEWDASPQRERSPRLRAAGTRGLPLLAPSQQSRRGDMSEVL